MAYIKRTIEQEMLDSLKLGKVVLLYGARQTGKSTMLKQLFQSKETETVHLNGDLLDVRELFENPTPQKCLSIMGGKRTLIIDEAQRIDNIGLALKIFIDNVQDINIIATGSSSFELRNRTGEALTGRKVEYYLTPFSFGELVNHTNTLEEKRCLEDRLIFGSYPAIVTDIANRNRELASLTSSYLYKDIFALSGLHKSEHLEKLVRALAFQIGSEVSYQELSTLVGLDRKTVEKYIDLLEQSFVVFRLPSFSRNLRSEIKKSVKIYFWDTGIRNAVIGNVLPLSSRAPNEIGHLWENYIIAERKKKLINEPFAPRSFFYRTHSKQEIDYLEETPQGLTAYEIKWNSKKSSNATKAFLKAYPDACESIISRDNYAEFIM